MRKDCHTHPNIINKPWQVDEFIETAISLGLDEIHFTDHMPAFPANPDPESDQTPIERIGDYCKIVREKAEKHADKIKILCGFEIDYHPDSVEQIEDVLSRGEFDVILGSSHLDRGEKSLEEFSEIVLKNYLSAAKSGYFTTLAHLDYYRRPFAEGEGYNFATGEFDAAKLYEPLLRELFSEMEKRGITLEINAAPLYAGFDKSDLPYPHPGILAIASEYNLKYSYGSDAHCARHIGYGYDDVLKIVRSVSDKIII